VHRARRYLEAGADCVYPIGLAAEAGIEVPITMEALDDYLAGRGWQPTPEMIPTLAKRNDWVAARFRA
jgi:hypothetical protein